MLKFSRNKIIARDFCFDSTGKKKCTVVDSNLTPSDFDSSAMSLSHWQHADSEFCGTAVWSSTGFGSWLWTCDGWSLLIITG